MREGWTETTLGELCTLTKGASPTLKTLPGEYPLVVTGPEPLSSAEFQFEGEAVCIPMVSSTGHGHASLKRVHYASGRFAVANIITVAQVRNPNEALTRFLWLYLQHYKEELIVSRMKGTANVSVSQKVLATVPLQLPPRHEQQRIVDLIGAVDDAIEAANQAEGAYQKAASALRSRTFEALNDLHGSTKAGEFFEVVLGRQKSARQSVGGYVIPYLRAANVLDGALSLADVQTMNFDPKEQSKYCLRAGDVLVVEGGSIGQTAVWGGEIAGPVGYDKHVLRLRGVEGVSTVDFAFQWARWCYESGHFMKAATGITIKALGLERAKALTVPSVPAEVQGEIVGPLAATDEAVTNAKALVDSLRTVRSNLLTALLSGAREIPETYDTALEMAS